MLKYCPSCGSVHSVKHARITKRLLCKHCDAVIIKGAEENETNPPPANRQSTPPVLLPVPKVEILFHCLVSVTGPKVLSLEVPIFIGRDKKCDICIPHSSVSRIHAKIILDERVVVLSDLNSQNGVLVNEELVQKKILNDHDDIRIGSESFIYRRVKNLRELRDSVRLRRRSLAESTVELSVIPEFIDKDEFRGTVAAMSMCDVCQMLSLSRRSGHLHLSDSEGGEAYAYFEVGQLIFASYDDDEGEAAALRLLNAPDGTFVFEDGTEEREPNIYRSTDTLLLESLRLRDENAR